MIHCSISYSIKYVFPPPPLCNLPPPPGGELSLGPKSIENTRRRRRQGKFLQGAEGPEADLHFYTIVQICGAIPPPPRGGGPSLHDCSRRGELAEQKGREGGG